MCGIFGALALGDAPLSLSSDKLRAQAVALHHRGPDYTGELSTPRAYLAHTRLSIIDLDPRSHQPMISADERWALVFNGEIYNFRALTAELRAAGANFRTSSDTEVILHGAAIWGVEGLLARANGMFAFVLHDRAQEVAHFCRDRMGEKPLFWAVENQQLVFASEMVALMGVVPPRLSASGLDAYLTLGFPLPQDHLIAGVQSVPPGHHMRVNLRDGGRAVTSFWEIRRPGIAPLAHADIDGLEERVRASIESRMIADVPLCGFLSGGIDSGLIAAMASKHSAHPYRTYCIGYEGEEAHNEFAYARMVADRYKLDHHEIRISMSDAKTRLIELVEKLDEPISNWVWLPLHFLTERARGDGYKVAMVGEGADEIFFGYNSMTKALAELNRQPGTPLRPVLGALGNTLGKFASEGHKTWDGWRRAAAREPAYMGTSFAFPRTQRPGLAGDRLISEGRAQAGYEFIASIQARLAGLGPHDGVDLISHTEIYAKMIEVLVRRVDRITMLHGLEARAPFLDHELAEYVFRLPGAARLVGGHKKGWLREVALRHLPRECVVRKKQGFAFPFNRWLHKEFRPLVQQRFQEGGIFQDGWLRREFAQGLLDKHLAGKRDYAPQIWHLYTLAVWYDRWIKGTR